MICTFYSYKGGVGRSMALAHVAYTLAERGLRVLMVDFDLEAPGLERYCFAESRIESARGRDGLVELILAYRRALTSQSEFDKPEFRNWRKFVQTVRDPVSTRGGKLDLMTAGRRDPPERLREYALTVRSFDWADFFHNWNGDRFFEWLRLEWSDPLSGYDVVLVDSRTGVTEMGGVCAYQLADVVVLLCAPNFQNLDGTVDTARDFLSPGVVGLRRGRPLQLLAVPARLDADHKGRKNFLEAFEKRLAAYWPAALKPVTGLDHAALALPYLARFAVAEPLVGEEAPPGDKEAGASFQLLRTSLGKLANALTLLAPPDSALGRRRAEALAEVAGQAPVPAAVLEADTSLASAGFDFFIDHGAHDAAAAGGLAKELLAQRFEVFIDLGTLQPGAAWSDSIERGFTASRCVLVCFGRSSASGIREQLLERARRPGGPLLVPLLLEGASEGAVRSFGLEVLQWIDLRKGFEPDRFRQARDAARQRAASGGAAIAVDTSAQVNPYRGVAPYGEDDASTFAGRIEEVRALLQRVHHSSTVLLGGAAKVGKSSLVAAGLLPALREEAQASPAPAPRTRLFDAADPHPREWPAWDVTPGFQLIVIDHTDSLVGAPDTDQRAERRRRVHALIAGAREHSGRCLLLVLRGWQHDEGELALRDAPGRERFAEFQLTRLDGPALREAISQPARRAGQMLEPGLAERLIESAGPAPSAVVQMQLVLCALWPERRDGWLTNRALDALDHLAGVFQRHVEACLAGWAGPERQAARRLFTALTWADPTGQLAARPLPWPRLRSMQALEAVGPEQLRDQLVAVGLLDLWHAEASAGAGGGGGEQIWVALARTDPRAYPGNGLGTAELTFLAWRARLTPLLFEWQRSGMRAATLLPASALTEAEASQWRWAELFSDEREYLAASMRHRAAGEQVAFAMLGVRLEPVAAGASGDGLLRFTATVLPGSSADAGETARITATPGVDVIGLALSNGPSLVLHPQTARELMLAQTDLQRSDAAPPGRETPAATGLRWRGLERISPLDGVSARAAFGDANLAGLHVYTVATPDKPLPLSLAVASCDGQVDEGVYELAADGLSALKGSGRLRSALPPASNDGPLLVLLHGGFVDTVSTFGGLWSAHPALVRDLFAHHAGRVYALEQATVGAGPIRNALTLAQACPAGARLHLLAHGRGALVAEVLARVCARGEATASDLAVFEGAGGARDRADLKALASMVKRKRLRVDRVVRVAAALHGSTFARGRLDVHLSMLRWALSTAGAAVPAGLDGIAHAFALKPSPLGELPGLAAMLPGSPLLRWLHSGERPSLPGTALGIAGDADPALAWYKTLVADRPGDTAGDLIVAARSMHGGPAREGGEHLMLERGGTVGHFACFRVERTARAMVDALRSDTPPPQFRPLWAATPPRPLPVRLPVRAKSGKASATRPLVFVVPGLFGSDLGRPTRVLQPMDPGPALAPPGLVAPTYGPLLDFLARDNDVIAHAFDWRRPLEEEAQRFSKALQSAFDGHPGRPVRCLAHSTGGLLARVVQLQSPAVWSRWMARAGTRLLTLGTPHRGLWAPLQLACGEASLGDPAGFAVEAAGDAQARDALAGFSGWMQAQAGLLDDGPGLAQAATWQRLADDDLARLRNAGWWAVDESAVSPDRWGVPRQAVLDQAVALQRHLRAQGSAWAAGGRVVSVLGQADLTPAGFEAGESGFTFRGAAQAGDGVVTDDSALVDGAPAWRIPRGHFDLCRHAPAFEALAELLASGSTQRLEPVPQTHEETRGPAAHHGGPASVRLRDARTPRPADWPPLAGEATPPDATVAVVAGAPVAVSFKVSVVSGDLSFCAMPLLLGHYRTDALTGTEAVADARLGAVMRRQLASGVYPVQPGTSRVFENTAADASGLASFPRLPAAIVVGLGDEGRLRSSELVYAVRTGIVAWAERQSRLPSPPGRFDLAATLIGSSSGEVSVSHSAQMIVQAARAANEQLATQGWPRLGHLQLVELFHDRACEAWRALRLQPDAAVERVGSVGALPGSLRRSLSGYRGVTHDSLTALLNSPSGAPPGDELTIAYTLDSQMSRGPLRATQTASALLRSLVATASNQPRPDAALAGTLYRLLVPSEFDAYLAGSAEMVLTLDAATAAFPWEMVGLPGAAESAARPLAVRSKLLRKLRIAEFRAQLPNPGAADNVLVIGAPLCDPAIYPPLPGARAEAEAVLRTLTQAGTGLSTERVRALTKGASAAVVIQALFERPYRVLHLAGHASPGAPGTPAGIVLSGGHVLSAAEFEAMGVVPELVVVSCGHLPPADSSVTPYDRTAFAASLAEELLRIGVRCVVATGWVVESAPALQFASAFHAALRAGERFIDAVGAARGAAWRADPSGVTWGAYQCYGDPDWTWRRAVPDAPALTLPPGDAFAYIEWHGSASPAGERAELALDEEYADIAGPPDLALVLETIATRVMGAAAIPRRQIDRLRYLEARHAADWGQIGAVGEAFGLAWAQTGELDAAIAWYARAVDAADGTASFRAAELAASLLARRGTLQSAAPAARQDIRSAIAQLSALIALRSTVERQSLLGSAYKRLAMVENRAGQGAAEQRALARTAEHYGAADALAEDGSSFYPAKNALDAELRLAILQGRRPTWGPARVARVTRSLHRAVAESPDFWSVVCLIELQLLQAIAQRNLAPAVTGLTASFQDLKTRVPSSAMWDSVFQGARFTLEPYHAVARGTERRAAAGMLAVLASMAGTE